MVELIYGAGMTMSIYAALRTPMTRKRWRVGRGLFPRGTLPRGADVARRRLRASLSETSPVLPPAQSMKFL
ncbi:MAG: hypothetical protein COV75_07045 [Candidatus Omnitrophica bacterium CG11_big_fil_rev_8_21_14_0_20_63_9]|nr:MAG: hypothetical protein COV75_07045 [Candidatus Omnitrophica bacterium CG11_big_fil_rev_8_21_14_0_20_63_9]